MKLKDRNIYKYLVIGLFILGLIILTNNSSDKYVIQYMDEGDMKTEIYNSFDEYNNAIKFFQENDVIYWTD